MTMSELFTHLEKNMENDLEKTALPLIVKTGDTNKFLREDCHVALDAMVEHVASTKVIGLLSSESILNHKNPTVRGTVARLLAYEVDRLGVAKALSGTRDITDKIVPAIAKLAQDGSQEARNFAKLTLVMFIEQHPDWERSLKKNLTQNTMRNLEKIIDALRQTNGSASAFSAMGTMSGGRGRRRFVSGASTRRRALSRKTL